MASRATGSSQKALAPRAGSARDEQGRFQAGRAHEAAGRSGAHPMAVPGMPGGQGGNRNPNRVSSTGTQVPNSTPMPHNGHNDAEPTNPRLTNGPGTQDPQPGRPPAPAALPTPDPMRPTGRLPNNPRGETTVPTERAPRPRMY